jgi:hypothetical protein
MTFGNGERRGYMAPQQDVDPDLQHLTSIVQGVLTSPAVADTVKRIEEIKRQVYDLQEELQQLERALPGFIQTAITTPVEGS